MGDGGHESLLLRFFKNLLRFLKDALNFLKNNLAVIKKKFIFAASL